MNIVVEGADNSGKSTLISYLHKVLKLPVIVGKGPPRTQQEINQRVLSYLTYDHVIFDRHPAVSNFIYDQFRDQSMPVSQELIQQFYATKPLFIYCRSDDSSLEGHQIMANETPEQIELVENHHRHIRLLYDTWALSHATIIYQKGRTRMSDVAKMVAQRFTVHTNFMEDILEFHTKFGLVHEGPARHLADELGEFRTRFLEEELSEYREARDAIVAAEDDDDLDPAEYAFQLEKQFDALVDLVYVALGNAYLQGFDFNEGWRRVHLANLAKVRAKRADDSKRGSTFDVIKPRGWEAPSLIDLVEVNDYEA